MTDPITEPSLFDNIKTLKGKSEEMTDIRDGPITYRPGDIRVDRRTGQYVLDFASLYPPTYNNHQLRYGGSSNRPTPVVEIREIQNKDIGINWRRFDNIPCLSGDPELIHIEKLFAGVQWDRQATRDFSHIESCTVAEKQRVMDDRRFAILAHLALQRRPNTFEELLAEEKFVVPISNDVRFIASSSRGMQETMILRYKLRILAGQWIVRIHNAAADGSTSTSIGDIPESDKWIGLSPDGIKMHSLDKWIELTHRRTFVQLLASDDREYDIIRMESTIGKWASFEKIAPGADNTMGFQTREWMREPFEENFRQASPEKQFPGAMAYVRDKKHPLHNILMQKLPILQRRKHSTYMETRNDEKVLDTISKHKKGKQDDSSASDSSEQITPRLATERDMPVMTEEEAKRKECRERLRVRHQRKKTHSLKK